MSGLEDDCIFPLPFSQTDNICIMLSITTKHVTQENDPKSLSHPRREK
jgi:hypothetical protein